MNMFARFDENPAMTLQDIKETKRYGRTHARTDTRMDGRTDGQRENGIPTTNKVCGGIIRSLAMPGLAGTPKDKKYGFIVFKTRTKKIGEARNCL